MTVALAPYGQHALVLVAHGNVARKLVTWALELGEALVHFQQEADVVGQLPLLAAAVAVEFQPAGGDFTLIGPIKIAPGDGQCMVCSSRVSITS